MATASVPNSFSASTTIIASQVNANFTSLVNFLNGQIDQGNFAALTGTVTWSVTSNVLSISSANSGTEGSVKLSHTGVLASGKSGLWLVSSAAQTTGTAGLYVQFTSASSSIPAMQVDQAGTGDGLQINHTGTPGSSNAAFRVISTTAGSIALPKMTTSQRDAVSTPAAAGGVYNTTNVQPEYYTGSRWAEPVEHSFDLTNCSIAVSVAANALTFALKTKAGADPSATDPVKISFRSSTATTGTYNRRAVTSALSVVIPASTTIGTLSAIAHTIYAYALDNAGTVELALSLNLFDEGSTQNTSAISAGASATTLYSTTARTGVPIRLLGKFVVTEATAGTWASAPTEISNVPFKTALVGATNNDLTWTFSNLGTVSTKDIRYQRVGDRMNVFGYLQTGTTVAGVFSINLPSGITIDTAKITNAANAQMVGMLFGTANSAGIYATVTAGPYPLFFDGSTNNAIFLAKDGSGATMSKANGSIFNAGANMSFHFSFPVTGWGV